MGKKGPQALELRDSKTGKILQVFDFSKEKSTFSQFLFSPNEATLAILFENGLVRLWKKI